MANAIGYTEDAGVVNYPVASLNSTSSDIEAWSLLILNSSGKLAGGAAAARNRFAGILKQKFDAAAYAGTGNPFQPAAAVVAVQEKGRIVCKMAASEAAAKLAGALLLKGSGTNNAIIQADLGRSVYVTDVFTLEVNPTSSLAARAGKITKIITVGTDGNGECEVTFDAQRGTSTIQATCEWLAASVDKRFFVANRDYRVRGIRATPTVAGSDGSAVTAVVRKVPTTTAITSGTALHSSSIDLKGTADTVQALTLSTTYTELLLAAGDSLAIDFTGTLTAATGAVTVDLEPLGG